MSNNPSLMGSYIAEKMQTYITEFSKNKFTLIDRLDIAKLIDEIEVHGKDDFDIDKWAKKTFSRLYCYWRLQCVSKIKKNRFANKGDIS